MRRRAFIALLGGVAVALPVAAGAQQPVPVIGYLSPGSLESDGWRVTAFRQGLNGSGYVEGKNVAIEYRGAQGQYDRLPGLAADLVRRQVTVMAAIGGLPLALAARAATTTIPIVFDVGIDPVQFGLVASLNRPGGNITGVALLSAELAAKRLELLHELAPTASVVALLANPTNPVATEAEARNLQNATRSLGLQLHILPASTANEIDSAFETLVELRAGALIVRGDAFFTERKDQIISLAAHHAVPATYAWREYATAGGLMSYGTDLADGFAKSASTPGKSSSVPNPPIYPSSRS